MAWASPPTHQPTDPPTHRPGNDRFFGCHRFVFEVVVELKDAVGKSEVAEEKEIEIEIEEDGDKPKLEFEVGEKSVVPEIPGKDVSQSEIIVESKPDCGCMAKKEVKLEKSAATEEEFCRFAKLSPANRKKLGDYWKNMLGFPKDYVDLMVKDYEK